MVHAYLTRLAASPLLLASGLLLAVPAAHAQFNYRAGSSANVVTAYTDLGSTGTVIATPNFDNANSGAQNIGFSFSYNGQAFTQFVLNTNGAVRLGATAPSVGNLFGAFEGGTLDGTDPVASTNPADTNLLLPFNFDLEAGSSTPEYRVATTGSAPNRVCTVQWKNVSDKEDANPKQYSNFSFQLKLYETTNVVEFVYGTATASANTAIARYPTVGIKGSGARTDQTVLAYKELSSLPWSDTVFLTGEYDPTGATHNFRADVGPDAGRTYRFSPCAPTVVTAFPYAEDFNGVAEGSLPCGAAVADANNDTYSWFTAEVDANDNALVYAYNDDDDTIGGDDWYYTPGLTLRAGYTYQLKFDYAAYSSMYPEGLEVKWGSAATPAGQTTTIFSNLNIANEAFATTTTAQVTTITPTTTGVYYIGFHEVSAPDAYALLVDNLQVTETQSLSVRNQANAAFTAEAAPVPFGESLSLHLAAQKAGPLALTLRDVMGRVVRQQRSTAPAGASTVAVPEVASLPAGVYLLTVEQGGQSQVLRLTHQ